MTLQKGPGLKKKIQANQSLSFLKINGSWIQSQMDKRYEFDAPKFYKFSKKAKQKKKKKKSEELERFDPFSRKLLK